MPAIPLSPADSWSINFAASATSAERSAIDRYFRDLKQSATGTAATDHSSIQLIKKGAHREVARLIAPGADLHIKSNRLHNLRARLRRLLRPAKSQLEFDTLGQLAKLGIATIEPVAWAEHPDGLNLLFTRTIDHSQTLDEVYASSPAPLSIKTKGAIAWEVGRLLAAMHRGGFFHPDPHPGNLLWSLQSCTVRVIDLHQVRRAKAASLHDRSGDLAAWAAWTDLRLGAVDNLRILKRYATAFSQGALNRADWRQLVELIRSRLEERQQAFWRKQAALCVRGGHRRFVRLRQGPVRGMALGDKGDLMKTIARLAAPGQALPAEAVVLKESVSSRVFRFTLDGHELVVKQVPWKPQWTSRLARWFGFDPVRRAWYWTNALRLRLLPTPAAQGFFLDWKRQFSLLVTSEIPGAIQLDHWVRNSGGDGARKKALALQLARLFRRMHQRGVQHRDLKAANILVDRDDKAWLVDLAGVGGAPRALKERESRCKKDLARLAASFWANPLISHSLRLRFLQTYLWGQGREWGQKRPPAAWKDWWRDLAHSAEQRIRRNEEKGRPLG